MRLAPCPFCGAREAEVFVNISCHFAYVSCGRCFAEGPHSRTEPGPDWRLAVEHSAAVLWNDAACRLPGWGKV